MSTAGFAGTIWQDLRYGARLLRLNPVFTLVATLSLALGIGANTAIFQLLDSVRLRTLPVKNPQELAEVKIADRTWGSGSFSSRHPELSNPMWELIRKQQHAFSGIFAWSSETFNLARGGQARNAEGLWVSGDSFNVLGVPPILGRVFTAADDRRGLRLARRGDQLSVLAARIRWASHRAGQQALPKRASVRGDRCDPGGLFRHGSGPQLRRGRAHLL